MLMHLAVAAVTYLCLVRIAPAAVPPAPVAVHDAGRPARQVATVLALAVGLELVLGVGVLVALPSGRPSEWVPHQGTAVYIVHALLGLALALGAVVFVSKFRRMSRVLGLTAWIGLAGVTVAGVGGMLTVSHPLRIAGIVLMLLGSVVAAFGYVLPWLDRMSEDQATG